MENGESSGSKFEPSEKQEIFRALYVLLDKVTGDSKIPLTEEERKIIELLIEKRNSHGEESLEEPLEEPESVAEIRDSVVVELFGERDKK